MSKLSSTQIVLDGSTDNPPTPTNKTTTFCTMVLLPPRKANDKDSKDEDAKFEKQYALARTPQSYQDALLSAIEVLGEYMKKPLAENIDLFFPFRDKDNKWIWAKINPAEWDWSLNMFNNASTGATSETHSGSRYPLEIGVREKIAPNTQVESMMSEYKFTKGPILLSFGTQMAGQTTWTYPFGVDIDRPKSYKEAIQFIKNGMAEERSRFSDICHLVGTKDLNSSEFKFYHFVSQRNGKCTTDLWHEFPTEVKNNDALWRSVMPQPSQILGFTLHDI